MYDTIALRLNTDTIGARTIETLPLLLTDVSEHCFSNGERWLSGHLGNLTITANEHQVRLKEGSLCKWYLGDNFQVLGKRDCKDAVEALSDMIDLPFSQADVTRLDVSCNFLMENPIEVYLSHLGVLRYFKRLQEPNGLYYAQGKERLCFYDKIREERKQREPIPDFYLDQQVLRYEQRLTKKIPQRLKMPELKASTLWRDDFHRDIVNRWADTYRAIRKENLINFDYSMIKGKKDLYKLGILKLVEQAGGESEMLEQIEEARRLRDLTPKQARDLRDAIRDACEVDGVLTKQTDCIKELDLKVNEAVERYG